MLVVLCLIAAVLPWTHVESRKGGWADRIEQRPGDEHLYGSVIPGYRELGIRYYFTSRFSRICCEALTCSYRYSTCRFEPVGCGINSLPIQARLLPWELDGVEPIMRCYDSRGDGAYYSYTVVVEPLET